MDALENRVRAFTEGVVIMACPVLLALALNKVNLTTEGSGGQARRSISPLAASCLLTSFVAFAFLSATSILKSRFQGRLLEFLFRSSKFVIHSCAILQMVLAYMILLLITVNPKPWWIVSAAFGLVLLVCCVLSLLRSQKQDSQAYPAECDEKLEQSLDFSAAVASLLFLALEGLALEGQPSIDQGQGLGLPLVLTFVLCVVATFLMVLGTVPPAIHGNGDNLPIVDAQEQKRMQEKRRQNLSLCFDASCFALAIFFTAVVVMITWKLMKEAAVAVAAVPWVGTILVFVLAICDQGGNQPEPVNGVKPASLELTKVTFTGFLAVSISSVISDSSAHRHSRCTQAFVLITAMAAVSGLLWRLMTHFTMRAAAVAAYAACLWTHLCVTAAVVPFLIMATQAMAGAKDNKPCKILPCGSN